jgi:hypothetical protein
MVSRIVIRVRRFLDQNFTWKGIATLLFWVTVNVPDCSGRQDSWKIHIGTVVRFITAHNSAIVTVACALLIWLDHRALGNKQNKSVPTAELKLVSKTTLLPKRLEILAKELFAFLSKLGKEDPPSLRYVVMVHDGFMLSLFDKVQQMAYELGASGITDMTLGDILLRNQHAFSYETIQEIAEAMLTIKHKIELKAYKEGTLTGKDIDNMTSAELRHRSETDPDFESQVNTLCRFKQLS